MTNGDLLAFQKVFSLDELEWRIQQAGDKNGRIWAICVPYVTNRAIQTRLDEVVGPANWQNEFRQGPDGGVLCGIAVRVGEDWVTKWDGAENTDIEGVKGGLSNSMKRAAVQWGIGRYLYALDEAFATVHEDGRFRAKTKDGKSFRWDPPQLPTWALPLKTPSVPATKDSTHGESHDAMLQYLRTVGAQVPETAMVRINRKVVNLKEYVRENWSTIKDQPQTIRSVVKEIERCTGVAFLSKSARAAA